MKQTIAMRIGVLACALVFSASLLVACAPTGATAANAEQQANRTYMSQVNEVMEELGDGLGLFVDAVSRNDLVNMRTQAQNAYQALDKLDSLEVPEGLADIQGKYQEGTDKLREALNSYIDLYTEMNGSSFDPSTYDDRIAAIQSLYDEGVAALEEGDEIAASKS